MFLAKLGTSSNKKIAVGLTLPELQGLLDKKPIVVSLSSLTKEGDEFNFPDSERLLVVAAEACHGDLILGVRAEPEHESIEHRVFLSVSYIESVMANLNKPLGTSPTVMAEQAQKDFTIYVMAARSNNEFYFFAMVNFPNVPREVYNGALTDVTLPSVN